MEIDGSRFEGGGQILRLSVALSIICKVPVRIYNIRAGRSPGGLGQSHITAIALLGEICNARVEGNTKGSTVLEFCPGPVCPGRYSIDCFTAGSISLIVQAVLPVLLKTDSEILISGGTDVAFSPPTHFIQYVLQPFLEKIGVVFQYEVVKYGFYPKGMGKVKISTQISTVRPIECTRTDYAEFNCEVMHTTGYPGNDGKFSERVEGILNEVSANLGIEKAKIQVKKVNGRDKSVIVSVWSDTSTVPLHNSTIESFKKSNCDIQKMCRELQEEVHANNCVDQYLQDQILLYLSMATERSLIKINHLTLHTQAVIEIIQKFGLAQITFEDSILRILPQIL